MTTSKTPRTDAAIAEQNAASGSVNEMIEMLARLARAFETENVLLLAALARADHPWSVQDDHLFTAVVIEIITKNDWRNRSKITRTGRVRVTIDLGYIVTRLARAALRNKSRRAVMHSGHIKARVDSSTLRETSEPAT